MVLDEGDVGAEVKSLAEGLAELGVGARAVGKAEDTLLGTTDADQVADGRRIAALHVGAHEESALGEADSVEAVGELGVLLELMANVVDLMCLRGRGREVNDNEI